MKRIKVMATLFILCSAGLMNYHDHSMSSAKFPTLPETVMSVDSNHTEKIKACSHSEVNRSETGQKMISGKNYEATMIIM